MKKTVLLSLLAIMLVFFLVGCGEREKSFVVKYEITGPAITSDYVMYFTGNGTDNIQTNNVPIPWSHTFKVILGKYKTVGIGCSASLPYSNTSSYTARIYVNGSQVASSTSGSSYVSATSVLQNY